jgi:ABC-type methionine transport system permease subunit
MAGRRDALLTRDKNHPITASRIAVAVFIGVLLGCIFAFFSPQGFFNYSSTPSILNHKVSFLSIFKFIYST